MEVDDRREEDRTMRTNRLEQIERLLKEVATPEDIADIEKTVADAKARVLQVGKGEGTMRTRVAEQMEEILRGVTTLEDLAEIDRVIGEAKGKVVLEPAKGFWEEKTPCWEMTHCPEIIRNECPAFTYQTMACWKIEGTYCKLDDFGATGNDTSICQVCRVYKKHGAGQPIEMELVGRGINARVKSMEKLAGRK